MSGASLTNKEPLPPRHRRTRRKDEDIAVNQPSSVTTQRESLLSRGVQFDLEEASFPPLPGKNNNIKIFSPSNLNNVFRI